MAGAIGATTSIRTCNSTTRRFRMAFRGICRKLDRGDSRDLIGVGVQGCASPAGVSPYRDSLRDTFGKAYISLHAYTRPRRPRLYRPARDGTLSVSPHVLLGLCRGPRRISAYPKPKPMGGRGVFLVLSLLTKAEGLHVSRSISVPTGEARICSMKVARKDRNKIKWDAARPCATRALAESASRPRLLVKFRRDFRLDCEESVLARSFTSRGNRWDCDFHSLDYQETEAVGRIDSTNRKPVINSNRQSEYYSTRDCTSCFAIRRT